MTKKMFHCYIIILEVLNEGIGCWFECGRKQGPCNWCGMNGICCRSGWNDTSNGCDGSIGGSRRHECVKDPKKGKGSLLIDKSFLFSVLKCL